MTRKEFRGYTYEEVEKASSNIEGMKEAKYFDKLGIWKITVINYKKKAQ